MKIYNIKNRAIIFTISLSISILLFSIVIRLSNAELNKIHENERSNTAERYVRFQSAIESLISNNITILDGYMAFLNMQDEIDPDESIRYLENLIDHNDSYIVNISTIEDTTILFNYPRDGNESVVGLDLSQVESQREEVLQVKETLKPVFQGPVSLVQGGSGFISRMPLFDRRGDYYGQISLVVSSEAFLQDVYRFEKMHGLEVLFFQSRNYPDHAFYGSLSTLDNDPLIFSMQNEYLDWTIATIPWGGWTENYDSIRNTKIIGAVFSIILFFLIFFSIDTFDQSRMKLKRKNREITEQKDEIEALYEETFAMNQELEHQFEANRKIFLDTVSSLAQALDAKDPYTGGHSQRVMEYSLKIAEAMDLDERAREAISFGSVLHDIGKIGIPEQILNKEGSLTDDEYKAILEHPQIGFNIIQDLDLDSYTKKIIHEHHERIDGRGYPSGLSGNDIHLYSRIVCVADAYDAMTSKRSYRNKPLSLEQAIEELQQNSGTQFCSDTVDVFVKILMNELGSTKN